MTDADCQAEGSGPLLDVEGLAMSFGGSGGREGSQGVEVFSGVSLSVLASEMVVIAGRSGSGKSTILSIAAGLLSPTSGEVAWCGVRLSAMPSRRLSAARARHLGFVFQGAGLIGSLTAVENVSLPSMRGRTSDADRKHAKELLDLVGASDRANHFPSQLSGGEQQRVALARALFNDPPLLLIDEPTSNLDRATADTMIEICMMLKGLGRGLLIASHDSHVIQAASRVIQLESDAPMAPVRPIAKLRQAEPKGGKRSG